MAKKKKYITRSTVIRTLEPGKAGDKAKGVAPTPPKTKEIAAKTNIMLDPDDQETIDLLGMDAIALAASEAEVEDDDDDEGDEAKAAEATLRARYKELFGKAAPKNMKLDNMQAKVTEKEAEDEDDDNSGLV